MSQPQFPGQHQKAQVTENPDNTETKAVVDPFSFENDRHAAQLKKAQQTAAFGLYLPDVLKWKTGTDYSKNIQFSIRREFWTFSQVYHIMYWCLTIGATVGAGVVAGLTPGAFPDIFGPGSIMIWGVFLLSTGLAALWTEGSAKSGIRSCTRDKFKSDDPNKKYKKDDPKVEPEFQGKDCFTDWDCTRKSTVNKGVCKVPDLGGFTLTIRKGVIPVLTLVGVVMTAISFSSTDYSLPKKDLAQAIIYGLGVGNALMLLFS